MCWQIQHKPIANTNQRGLYIVALPLVVNSTIIKLNFVVVSFFFQFIYLLCSVVEAIRVCYVHLPVGTDGGQTYEFIHISLNIFTFDEVNFRFDQRALYMCRL